ncbi:MAG: sulfotransferase [Gilvibacter sp.]
MEFSHIHHVSTGFLEEFYQNYSPVFVLNTGRSGSAMLQNVFSGDHLFKAYHEAAPNLFLKSNYAYHNQDKSEILTHIFGAARTELILEACVANKIYVETNQCLVFYARQIKALFPKARFVHLTRHPGDFVRSAIRKGWHKNDSVWELGRIKMQDPIAWQGLDQIQKLSWVWQATHSFIEDINTEYTKDVMTVRLEDLIGQHKAVNEMLAFMGGTKRFTKSEHQTLFKSKHNQLYIAPNEPSNMFKLEEYPTYAQWDHNAKEKLAQWAAQLSDRYNYSL